MHTYWKLFMISQNEATKSSVQKLASFQHLYRLCQVSQQTYLMVCSRFELCVEQLTKTRKEFSQNENVIDVPQNRYHSFDDEVYLRLP